MFQNYKLLPHFVIWSVFIIVICTVTAGKTVNVFGIPLSVTIYFFPLVYIIADILTEVYGYAVARRVLWYTIAARGLTALFFVFVVAIPPADSFAANDAYTRVLSVAPQIALGGMLAVFAGDILNNYVLAKMKVWTQGRFLKARLVASTAAGELANSAVFSILGLWGILPWDTLFYSILMGALAKTLVEIILLPITLRIVAKVKRIEGVDHFDIGTDFNPLKV